MFQVLRKSIYLTILFFTLGTLSSQNFISGRITDSLNAHVPFIQIGLMQAKDSVIHKGTITNDSGSYRFDNISPGHYFVKVAAMGFKEKLSDRFVVDSSTTLILPDLKIGSVGINLNEVSINVLKNPIEFKNGNIIVNVEGSPLAVGNTLYDLLSRLPGVTIIDNAISIQGRQGAKIYIDDRLQQLSGNQLMNLLKGINASMIEKIEILKNPSVKYDAAGGAGIINVRTKKLKIMGFSGSINSTYTQAYYGNILSGFELNYKGKKLNFFSNINLVDESYRKVNHYDRSVEFNNLTSQLNQLYIEREHSRYYSGNVGFDWFIDKKNTVGFKISVPYGGVGFYDRSGNIKVANSDLGYDYSNFGFHKENPFYYNNANFNVEHKFDTLGTKLVFSSDYCYNYDLYSGDYFQNFYDSTTASAASNRVYRTSNRIDLQVIAGKLDFEKQVTKSLKMEAGLKAAYQTMLSDFYFGNKNSKGNYTSDSSLTNVFRYNESITAAYLNLQRSFKKINVQAGLRAENTHVNTTSKTSGLVYTRKYFNLFPVLSLDYNPSDKHSWQLSGNRRIERPDYNSFNPYKTFRNLLVSDAGNPFLRPMYMNTFNFSHNFKSKISNSVSYTNMSNIFFQNMIQNDSTKETVTTMFNLKRQDAFTYNLFIQQNIKNWWTVTFYASSLYYILNGTVNDLTYHNTFFSWYAGSNNQFLVSKTRKIELNAWYVSPWLDGISVYKPRWSVDLALRQSFLKEKLNVVLGCNDLFFTNIFRVETHFGNLQNTSHHTNDSRRIRLSLSYNFGNLKVQQRQIKSNDEESKRAAH